MRKPVSQNIMIYDGDEVCDVCLCGDFNSDNQIVFCDSCNCAVHQACYGISDAEVAADRWLCKACAQEFEGPCFLCGFPLSGFSSKEYVIIGRPAATRFVHCLCFRIFPSLVYSPDDSTIQITPAAHLRLESMREQFKKRPCLWCASKPTSNGITMVCRAPTGCTSTYHPLCLVLAGGGIWEEGFDTYDVIHALCPTHVSYNWATWRQQKVASGSFDNAMAEVQSLLLNPPLKQSLHQDTAITYKIGAHTVRDYGTVSTEGFMLMGFLDDVHQEVAAQYPLCVTSYQGRASEPYALGTHEAALLKHLQITARLTTSCPRCIRAGDSLRLIDDGALVTALERQFASCSSLSELLAQSLACVSAISSSIFVSLSLVPGMLLWRSFSSDKALLGSDAHPQALGGYDATFTIPCLELYLAVLQHPVTIFLIPGNGDTDTVSATILRPPVAVTGCNLLLRKGS